MECSCGSTSFVPGSSTLKVNDRTLLFEYSACKGCGRQGAERLSDKMTGAVMATGYEAIMRVQQIEADGAVFKPKEALQVYASPLNEGSGHASAVKPQITHPADEAAECAAGAAKTVSATGIGRVHPASEIQDDPVLQRMSDRDRYYLLWEGETQKARVLYYHKLYEGWSEVLIPWLGLEKNNSQTGLACADLLLSCLNQAQMALEQQFGEVTLQTAVTSAPPNSRPLEVLDANGMPSDHCHLQNDNGPVEEYLTFEFLNEIPIARQRDEANSDTPQDILENKLDPVASEESPHEEQLSLF